MKLEQFKQIKNEINQQFSDKYKGIRNLLYYSSYFGNCMSILLAFFFMSKLLLESISFLNSTVLIYIISLVILTGLELFKRGLFNKFSVEYVSSGFKFAKKEVIALAIGSAMIISFSFYSSLRGAAEFTSKENIIAQNTEQQIKQYSDSINSEYNVKIVELESEIKSKKEKINKKDDEQTTIQTSPKLTRTQVQRVKDLKVEKDLLKQEILENESKIKSTKEEVSTLITKYGDDLKSKSDNDKDKNKSNSFVFVIITTIIELLILIGIYFDKHYKWVSYSEYKTKLNNDPIYQKWYLYSSLIDIIYNKNTQIGEKLPSVNNMTEISKTNGILLTKKEATDFLRLLTNLKIFKLAGSMRLIQKDKETAIEALNDNFKIY